MDRLSIIQRDNAEKPGSRRVRFFNPAPETNAAVDLDLAAKRGCDDLQTPFTPNVGTFSQHLFLKIACRFQAAASSRSPRRLFDAHLGQALMPTLAEREFLVTASGDLVGRPPEMRAVAIVAENPAHGPARDVAIDAVLPGIDLERQ
jgi:hypothetical protein